MGILTTAKRKIGKDVYQNPLPFNQSALTRDSVIKTAYGKLFNWIVAKVNASINNQMESNFDLSESTNSIGLLDIFGFEVFERNSFEQLCINYANEKLQQQFNVHMFTLEMQEYKQELDIEIVD